LSDRQFVNTRKVHFLFCDLLFRVGQAKNSPKHQKRKKEKKTLSAATLARLGYFHDATPHLATRLLMTRRVIGGYGVFRWFVSSDLFFPFRPIFGIDGHISAGTAVTTITNPKSDFVYYPMTLGLYLRLIFFSTSLFHCLLLFPMLGIFSSGGDYP
jgi:hypothetical protein